MITTICLFGVLQALVLSVAILSLSGRPHRSLAALLALLAVATFTITAQHAGFFGGSIYLILAEYTATLLFPPVLWRYANAVLGKPSRNSSWFHFAPVAAWLSYLLAYSAGWTNWRWLPPIMLLVGYASGYSLAVAVRAWRADSDRSSLISHRRVLRVGVSFLLVLHAVQLFVDAGISTYETLRIATYEAARYLDRVDEFGSIRPGQRADFVVLDANPLADIQNTRSIAAVMVHGAWESSHGPLPKLRD